MLRSLGLICTVVALVAAGACKKNDKPKAKADPWAAGSGSAAGTADPAAGAGAGSAAAAIKPKGADTAPPPLASNFGAAAGDELAKLAAAPAPADGAAAPAPADGAKVDPASITKAGLPTMAVRGFAGVKQTGFRVAYAPSKDATHEQFRKVLEDNRVFELVAEGLNKTVRLPRTVDIQLVDCGTVNAFYDPNNGRIIVCYELLSYFVDVFKPTAQNDDQLGQAVIGATIFSFYHESGHALIHQLDLPTVGREEDAVDQLATLILMAAGDDGVGMALSGAYWFQLQQKAGNETPFWDEHAFEGQRFYNILCMIYGSDPGKYAGFVSSGNLPEARAQRCGEEYSKTRRAWEKLLEPHLTNDAAEEIDYQGSVPEAETNPDQAPTMPTADQPPGDDQPADDPPGDDQPGDDDPTAPVAAAGHAITCEKVAEKAVELIATEAEKQLADLSPDEQQAKIDDIKANLPAFLEQFLAQCAKEDWPDKDRQCVLDAATLDQASRCGN
ncbi:MAG: DUF4344 domain-containing metallopeptidase [Myxococcales bacterium]|nr:DUF4344 domain-containing metallopeptidase [Myxococcales bacterium]MBK7195809.1 DUF4344 domain-containing metallopeptidase [Myxococcales bacterium]MBP6846872.1 DUF4344 domain-containing metallopeptidase [Kofleriaceae bacterium]